MHKHLFVAILLLFGLSSISFAATPRVTIDFFYGQGCTHCAKAKPFLDTLESKYPELAVNRYEVWYEQDNQTRLQQAAARINAQVNGVPAFFIGDEVVIGYGSDETTGAQLESLVQKYMSENTPTLTDLTQSRYPDAIQYLLDKNIIKGYADNTFKPKNHINRAEFLKILMAARHGENAVGSYCFSDVTVEWFAPPVCFAKQRGVVNGYSDGSFKPANNINHAEALKMLAEAFDIEINSDTEGEWYQKYVDAAKAHGYSLNVKDLGSLVTREEMAEMVYKIMG